MTMIDYDISSSLPSLDVETDGDRSEYLMLGNLTCGYSKPCVLDLKVATILQISNIKIILKILNLVLKG